jgi:ABC-2 type transport system permease protein
MIKNNLQVHLEYIKIAVKTALEYRASFIIQVISMFLNDAIWVLFWIIFFAKFSSIGGWQFKDMILLYAIITTAYGLSGILFGNRHNIATIIVEGRLDYYLTLPKNILYHLLISKSSWFDLGDILFGLTLTIFFVEPSKIPLMLILTVMSSIILISFGIISCSLAFFLGNAEELSHTLVESNLGLASYPLSIYKGITRILVLTIIPAGFVAGVPVIIIKSFDIEWFLGMIGFSILIATIAIVLFYAGLKKYESGNLLYVRT